MFQTTQQSHSLDDWSGEGGLEVGHVLVFIFKVGAGLLAGGHPCTYGHRGGRHRGDLRDLSDLADRGHLGDFGRSLYWLHLQRETGVFLMKPHRTAGLVK